MKNIGILVYDVSLTGGAEKVAIKLAEEEKFDEFTALMWCQTLKALAYTPKKWHRKPYTFGTLFGFVMEKAQYAMHLLYNEKKK